MEDGVVSVRVRRGLSTTKATKAAKSTKEEGKRILRVVAAFVVHVLASRRNGDVNRFSASDYASLLLRIDELVAVHRARVEPPLHRRDSAVLGEPDLECEGSRILRP